MRTAGWLEAVWDILLRPLTQMSLLGLLSRECLLTGKAKQLLKCPRTPTIPNLKGLMFPVPLYIFNLLPYDILPVCPQVGQSFPIWRAMVGEPEVQFRLLLCPPFCWHFPALEWPHRYPPYCANYKYMSSSSSERPVVRERDIMAGTMGTDLSPSPCSLVTQGLHSWGKYRG